MAVYVLDTNIFIQAHRVHYPFDVATGFWNAIKQLAQENKIISIDKVKDEIDENEDELKDWIEANLQESFFKSTTGQKVMDEYRLMAPWAMSKANHYQQKAIDEFLDFDKADAWLISYCKSTGDILVTEEVSNPDRKNRIPIPEPCKHFGIRYCNMMKMFRELGVRF